MAVVPSGTAEAIVGGALEGKHIATGSTSAGWSAVLPGAMIAG